MCKLMIFIQTVKVKHHLKQIDRLKLVLCSLQNDCSVSVVYAGESTVENETEADSNDITETATPLHDKSSTGMFGFL